MSQVLMRKPTEDDLARFKECLRADKDHCNQDADSWIQPPGEFMVFYDQQGNRIWVRIERVLRVSIQTEVAAPRKAIISILYKGLSWLQGSARNQGFTQLIYESKTPRLVAFFEKLFGFKPIQQNYGVVLNGGHDNNAKF
jgi:hypothetical protein